MPPSSKVQIENDKINYILSSVFLLSNRLAKSMIALAELDHVISSDLTAKEKESSFKANVNEIISKYF